MTISARSATANLVTVLTSQAGILVRSHDINRAARRAELDDSVYKIPVKGRYDGETRAIRVEGEVHGESGVVLKYQRVM